jgi:hydroxymethylpyrimidine/phosphomethylpyrimidine kinase
MLSSAAITRAVARALAKHGATNIVVDPVMVSKSGSRLLKPEAVEALIRHLFPFADVVTPNLHEAAVIVGFPVEDRAAMERAAVAIKAMGPRYVVVKGGHLPGAACDLFFDGSNFYRLANERIDTKHTHGTGCTFSAAIAPGLPRGCRSSRRWQPRNVILRWPFRTGFFLGKAWDRLTIFMSFILGQALATKENELGKDFDL